MPDFTHEVFYHCVSAENFTMKVNEQTVTYGPSFGRYEYDYSCTCKGFKFRKACKHIEKMREEHCNWMQFINGGQPVEKNGKKCCPKCGSAVDTKRWAV